MNYCGDVEVGRALYVPSLSTAAPRSDVLREEKVENLLKKMADVQYILHELLCISMLPALWKLNERRECFGKRYCTFNR